MENKKNIEKLFEEKFQAYQTDPSPELWPKINRQLRWENFMRPRWTNFNIGYLSAIIIATAIGVLILNEKNINSELQKTGKLIHETENVNPESKEDIPLRVGNIQSTKTNSTPEKSALSKKTIKNSSDSQKSIETSLSTQKKDVSVEKQNSQTIKQDTASTELSKNQGAALLPPRAFYLPSCESGCAPLHLTFANMSTEATDFTWSFGDGGQSTDINPEYIFDNPGEYFVTLSARNENDEISIYRNIIRVNEVPEASFMIDKQVDAQKNIEVYFYNYSRGAENYSWDFGDGTTTTEANPTHIFDARADFDIHLKAMSSDGCIDTMILSNALKSQNQVIRFPNAFSPNKSGPNGGYYSNGENKNEIFHPVFDETPVEYQLRVFNRHGNLLFESKDLNIGWDGYYMQQLQPRGVYIYKLRVKFENGEYIVKMGDITVFIQD